MARKVLILGQTGTGKTFSIKYFKNGEVKVIEIHKPELSFRNEEKINVVKASSAKDVIQEMKNATEPVIIVDDFQFLLGLASMRRSLEKGWDKYSEMQYDYFTVLDAVDQLPDDKIVVFMSHTEKNENGETQIKTIGKALDKYITIESLFTVVLGTQVVDGQYYFITQNDGKNTLKSPYGMFDSYAIENNLSYVIDKIRNYYYLDGAKTDAEIKEADEEVAAPEVEKPTRGRRSRNVSPAVKAEGEKQKEDALKVINAADDVEGFEDAEEVPFEEVEKVIEEKTTRSRRRR